VSDPVLVALITTIGLIGVALIESGRRTRNAANAALEKADQVATAVGRPNGEGNVVTMSERQIGQLEDVLDKVDALSTDVVGMRDELGQFRTITAELVQGQAGQDRRIAAAEGRHMRLLEQQAATARCVTEAVDRVEQLEKGTAQ
jgi:hypothetical protein